MKISICLHRLLAIIFACGSLTGASADDALLTTPALSDLHAGFLLKPFISAGYFSSYDRTGENDDGFKGTWSSLYQLDNGEHVIVDIKGPGCLYTLWFTGSNMGYDESWGNLSIYLDSEDEPRVSLPGKDLFNGEHPLFPRPLVANEFISTGGSVAHCAIPFAERLIITTQQRVDFYNAYYHRYPQGTKVPAWPSGPELRAAADAFRHAGNEPVMTPILNSMRQGVVRLRQDRGGSRTQILHEKGRGVITSLRINPMKPMSEDMLNAAWLKCWWDDESEPSVNVPLGPFFGSAQGETAVRAIPIGMSASGPYYCNFRMPFESAARIELECGIPGIKTDVHYEITIDPWPDESYLERQGHFCAVYNQAFPTAENADYILLDLDDDAGLYLGHTLIVQPRSAADARWWEGDLRIRTDGRRHPFLHGTGHEDELLGGWSTRWQQNPYSLSMHGLPSVRAYPETEGLKYNGAITGYRFFAGGIPFRSGICVSTEHGTNNDVTPNYASVAFYYRSGNSLLELTDTLDLGDAASREDHHYTSDGGEATPTQKTFFDGDDGLPGAEPLTASGRHGQTTESFTLRIHPNNQGVLLRRLFHPSHGHSARILIDNQPAGHFHHPHHAPAPHRRQEDVILAARLTRNKTTLPITIQSTQGHYNAYTYEALTIRN